MLDLVMVLTLCGNLTLGCRVVEVPVFDMQPHWCPMAAQAVMQSRPDLAGEEVINVRCEDPGA